MNLNGSKKKRKNPEEEANCFSRAILWYTIPTFIQGYKRDLEVCDLYETIKDHQSNHLGNKIEDEWKKEIARASKSNRNPSLKRVLFRLFGWRYFYYGVLAGVSELIFKILQPLALGQLVLYYSSDQKQHYQNDAYWYSAYIIGCSFFAVFFETQSAAGLIRIAVQLKVACCSLIYRKALKLNKCALQETTVGQIINMLSNDINRFENLAMLGNYLWITPLQVIIITYILYQEVGIASLIGMASLLIFVPLQFYLGKQSAVCRLKTALRTDERIRLMNEIVTGIRVIKMYAWEKHFAGLVNFSRRFEMIPIRYTSYILATLSSLTMCMTRIPLFVTIVVYVLFTNSVDATKVFILTGFFNVLKTTIPIYFSFGIGRVAEAGVSLNRLNKLLLCEEVTHNFNSNITNGYKENTIYPDFKKALYLKNVTAKWSDDNGQSFQLLNINLEIEKGSLVGILGPVGSGKSTLFYSILNELPLKNGFRQINGRIAYCSQEAWIFPGTIRQNILLGLPLDEARYKEVITMCSLNEDLNLFPNGDGTLVGERGITLSGGQKARINLARAVYRDADIYLLDDPLSAVDTVVAKRLFKNCIRRFLRGKTVLLITHQVQQLKKVNKTVMLENGTIKKQGKLSINHAQFYNRESNSSCENSFCDLSQSYKLHKRNQFINSIDMDDESVTEENREFKNYGSISKNVYKTYLTCGSHYLIAMIVFLLFILAQTASGIEDYFVSYWVNIEEQLNSSYVENSKQDFNSFLSIHNSTIIYSILVLATVIVTFTRSFAFFSMCIRSSIALHDNMFQNISHSTMKFFNVNNSGRILNRFSKDMGIIDESIPGSFLDSLQIGLNLIGAIAIVAIVNPWLLIPTVVFCLSFHLIRKIYLAASQSIKRLEGITSSPVFGCLSTSIQGLTTIRAIGAEKILQNEFEESLDLNSSAYYWYLILARTLTFYLDILCVAYSAIVTFSFPLFDNNALGGNVGLAITQVIGLTGLIQYGIKQSTKLENQMIAVERVLEYSNLEQESNLNSTLKPHSSWPSEGKITFSNLSLRYSPDGPMVLKNLNFTVNSKEKVGIVGRTGAGKSSLISALFRLTKHQDGSVVIDGISIQDLGLHDLRSKISIIPQDPFLFSGTVRKNLDPFDEYTDEELWKALEDVEMKKFLDLNIGLYLTISEGGSNLSVGQRQLLCLARAILRKNKILVLDEATANVDLETDLFIQNTIRKKFKNCTVLIIAHRLNTIIDLDKVVVIDAGCLVEHNHPFVLLQNKNGSFYKMVQETGETMARVLTDSAAKTYGNVNPVEDLITL